MVQAVDDVFITVDGCNPHSSVWPQRVWQWLHPERWVRSTYVFWLRVAAPPWLCSPNYCFLLSQHSQLHNQAHAHTHTHTQLCFWLDGCFHCVPVAPLIIFIFLPLSPKCALKTHVFHLFLFSLFPYLCIYLFFPHPLILIIVLPSPQASWFQMTSQRF